MIKRKISNIEFYVDEHSARDIYFTEETVNKYQLQNANKNDILNFFSKDKYYPLYLVWEILDKCNFSCPFCYIVGHSNNKLIRFKDVKEHIDELINKGLLYCLLTGGEVLRHKDFKEIYKYLKQKGVFVEIYTNGYYINDELIELFKEYPPYLVEISIYGITDSVFQQNTNTNYKADIVLNNIDKLLNNNIILKCKTVINKLTVQEIEHIKEWCRLKGVEHYHSTDTIIAYDGTSTNSWSASDEINNYYDAENEISFKRNSDNSSKNIVKDKIKKCFTCSVGSYGLHINSKFELLPCSSFNSFNNWKYNILDDGIEFAIERMLKNINQYYHQPIKNCYGCEAYEFCKICPAIAEEYRQNGILLGFSTSESFCKTTRKRYNNIIKLVK